MELKELLNIEQPVSLNSLPVDQMKDLQRALANLGYPVGEIDGLVGPRTRSAWSEFQNDVSKRDPTQVDTASVMALQQQLAKLAQPHVARRILSLRQSIVSTECNSGHNASAASRATKPGRKM